MKNKFRQLLLILLLGLVIGLVACSQSGAEADNESDAEEVSGEAETETKVLQGKLELSEVSGRIGDEVTLFAEGLNPNEPLTVVWADMIGSYLMEDNYSFIGSSYEPDDMELLTDTADADGKWSGTITIPDGFGDDHDILIYQDDQVMAKANYFVETVFTMEPESGPVGTEITIKGEGLSWKMYGSLWHVNYDNKYTGMITGVSTKGSAEAVIRAAGKPGAHTITVESGSSGHPYLNRQGSSINYINTHYFEFTVTDEEPEGPLVFVEEPPAQAASPLDVPEPENQAGVEIFLDKETGIVGEEVVLSGKGLPENETLTIKWHTMVGNRVSLAGYGPEVWELGSVETDESGEFDYPFAIPEDLGGYPHLIEVVSGDEVYGQTYLRILPSIVSISPQSGPPGTKFTVTIQGSGWTEFDNALAVTYDNSYIGYICGFNKQGTIELPLIASGDPGYHVIDIYPSIYKGQQVQPDIYLKPQLTYREDHPGTAIPALRILYEVTEE